MKADHIISPISRSAEDPDEMTMTIDKDSIAHIMHLLRNNLYGDKIGSPVREYASNAADAHTEAGIPEVPIRIHLPYDMDPYFRVEDQGAGLTEGEMDRIFRRFGRSTKRGTNDTIGCLGIGAKSAFAYTDSFMVTSYTVRGTSRSRVQYSIYLDESRLGKITVLDRRENPEGRTGLTVEIPVRPDDFFAFRNAVEVQLRFFQPTPICSRGDRAVKFHWEVPHTICPGVQLDSEAPRVIMGGVQYVIAPKQIRTQTQQNVHGEVSALAAVREKALRAMLQLRLLIYVPIGAVEVDASREGLSYVDKTQRTIVAHCRLACRRITRAISAELHSLPTRADAIYRARLIAEHYRVHDKVQLHWHGKPLSTRANLTLSDVRPRRLEIPIPGRDAFSALWAATFCEQPTRKPIGTERHFIPVLQNVVARTGLCKIAERLNTLKLQHPGATIVLYRVPKRIPQGIPITPQELCRSFLKMVFWKAFGLSEVEVQPDALLSSLLDLWAELGGIQLQDIQPTAFSATKPKGASAYTRYVKKPLDCSVITYDSDRNRHAPLASFLMTPALQQPVVYWVVSDFSRPRTGYMSSDYRTVTRQHGSVSLQATVQFLQALYGVRVLLLETNLNRHTELQLPASWLTGQDWLAARLLKLPVILRYYWQNDLSSTVLANLQAAWAELSPALQELVRHRQLLSMEARTALKFLLQPTLTKCLQTIDRTEELPEYRAALTFYRKLTLTGPVTLSDPLAEYPLLHSISNEAHASHYIRLVKRVTQLESELEQLKASQTVLPFITTPSNDTTETQVLQPEDLALALA